MVLGSSRPLLQQIEVLFSIATQLEWSDIKYDHELWLSNVDYSLAGNLQEICELDDVVVF